MLACISVAITEEQEQKGTVKVQWNNLPLGNRLMVKAQVSLGQGLGWQLP